MESLFPKLMQLLEQRDDCLDFIAFKNLIGEPTAIHSIEDNTYYRFDQFGCSAVYEEKRKKFWMIGIEYSTVPVKLGAVQAFKGTSYAGIKNSDTCKTVEEKLGVKAASNASFKNMSRSKYNVGPYLFDCIFEGTDGPLQGLTVYLQDAPPQTRE
ncbi:MAG: hypothetical protein P4L53_14675 [Candidatus Obscuribacterales bacterium]|nr:hypothetical protein [Candidatus Obscuribacterales bacterium]